MEQRSFNLKARLREARKNLVPAISAAELGRKLVPANLPDFKSAHASMLELGYRYATWSEVEALAQVLNVDPYWLANKERPAPSVPRARDVVWHAEVQAIKPKVVPVATPASVPTPALARPAATPITPPAPPAAPPDLTPAEVPVLVLGGEIEFRRKMVEELARTLVKLGDTRLKPFEWRSWREHEKKIRAAAVGLVALPE